MNIDHHAKIARQAEDSSGYSGDDVRPLSAEPAQNRKARKAKDPDRPVAAKKRAPQKRAIEARKRILKAALDCFGAYGFEGTSTRMVAQRAGVTHTLVLYYFNSKDDLWLAMMDDALGTYSAALAENLDNRSGKSAAERLRIFIEQFVRLSADMPQIHRIMTMEGNQDTDRLEWVINCYLRDHFGRIKDLIKKGQEEGSVRDCDASRLYYFILGAGGTPFTLSTEYRAITGRDVFSEPEILRNVAFLYELVFI